MPIVEPEILMDGPHSIEHCAHVTEKVLACVYKALADNLVLVEGTILKPNMVCPGSEYNKPCSTAEMAFYTGTAPSLSRRRNSNQHLLCHHGPHALPSHPLCPLPSSVCAN